METFEETSRITNVSTTMFPSLPSALWFTLANFVGDFVPAIPQTAVSVSITDVVSFDTCTLF